MIATSLLSISAKHEISRVYINTSERSPHAPNSIIPSFWTYVPTTESSTLPLISISDSVMEITDTGFCHTRQRDMEYKYLEVEAAIYVLGCG